MTQAAITFNHVSMEVKIFQSGKRGGKRSGGSGCNVKGVQDILAGQNEALSVIERLESGNSTLSRKQRMFCTAFVRAVAQRRSFEKKAAPSQFVAQARKAA